MFGSILLGAAGLLVGGTLAAAGITAQTVEQMSSVAISQVEVAGLEMNRAVQAIVGGATLALSGAVTLKSGIDAYVRSDPNQ